jgi:hypothetical protein
MASPLLERECKLIWEGQVDPLEDFRSVHPGVGRPSRFGRSYGRLVQNLKLFDFSGTGFVILKP